MELPLDLARCFAFTNWQQRRGACGNVLARKPLLMAQVHGFAGNALTVTSAPDFSLTRKSDSDRSTA
jgi:hypothetical protein